jgi:Domain of unknown function (DUF6484)
VPTKSLGAQSQPVHAASIAPSEGVIGLLAAIDNSGRALVSFQLADTLCEQVPALTTQIIDNSSVGRQVVLLFAAGNQQQPVIMGFIHSPLDLVIGQTEVEIASVVFSDGASDNGVDSDKDLFPASAQFIPSERAANVDGKRLVFEAEEEVQIKCGEASINLYKDGRVVIRGRNLISRASVVNRILGGSVQVN